MSVDIATFLDKREKDFPDLPTDQYGYKLTGGTYGMDVPMLGDLDIDQSTFSMWIPIASGVRRDGVGDLLEVDGIKTERHVRNPIVLFDHGKEISLPIARARENPKDPDSYTFKIDAVNKSAGLRAFFYTGKDDCALNGTCKPGTHAQFVEELFDMAVKRQIGSGSIGYQVISGEHLPPDYVTGLPQGLHLKKILMLEGSLVVLPANMDTVAKALTGGRINGRQPTEHFVKAFSKYMPAPKAQVVGGFATKALDHPAGCTCEKCMAMETKGHACGCDDCQKGHACPCESKTLESKKKYITHTGSKWVVHAESGKVLGTHDSKKDAEAQLRAVEANKHKGLDAMETKAQPSSDISPDKACQILKDGEANGKPLSEAQRGMFGAACGRRKKSLRVKYKRVKPFTRTVHVNTKDLDRLRAAAQAKGIPVKWLGDNGKGLSKVQLTGDSKAIELLANSHGKAVVRQMKSLNGNTKAGPVPAGDPVGVIGTVPGRSRSRISINPESEANNNKTRPDDQGWQSSAGTEEDNGAPINLPVLTAKSTQIPEGKNMSDMNKKVKAADALVDPAMEKPDDGLVHDEGGGSGSDMAGDMGSEAPASEPYGMQVARRIHADHSGLLHEYDQFMNHLEDPETKKLVQEVLEGFVELLEKLEGHKDKHEVYKDLPPYEGTEKEDDELGAGPVDNEGPLGEPVTGGLEAADDIGEEVTPEEALQGMENPEEDEMDYKSFKAQVKSLRKQYDSEKIENYGKKSGKETLGDPKHAPGHEAEEGSAMDVTPKKKDLADQVPAITAKSLEEQKKTLLDRYKAVKAMEKEEEEDKDNEIKLLNKQLEGNFDPQMKRLVEKRLKALSFESEGQKKLKEEKSLLSKKWKELKEQAKSLGIKGFEEMEKEDEKSEVKSFVKRFTSKHSASTAEVKNFLTELSQTKDYGQEMRLKSYHYGCKMADMVDDVMAEGKSGEGIVALRKALITQEEVNVTKPSGPSKYNPGQEPMQQWGEGGSTAGKKDFPEMNSVQSEVNVTKPSSNAWVKPGEDNDVMPYKDGPHLIAGVKDYPEMNKADNEVDLTHPGGPSKYKPGQEPMQQFGDGGSLVKFLKVVSDAGAFLKAIAYEKAFGFAHRQEAAQFAKAMEGDMPYVGQGDKDNSFPGDLEDVQNEMNEKDLEGSDAAMGAIGEKSLSNIYQDSLNQAQTINSLTQSLNNLLAQLN